MTDATPLAGHTQVGAQAGSQAGENGWDEHMPIVVCVLAMLADISPRVLERHDTRSKVLIRRTIIDELIRRVEEWTPGAMAETRVMKAAIERQRR